MSRHPDSGDGANESPVTRFDGGSFPTGLLATMLLIIGLAVWQFGSLAPKEIEFPTDQVDAVVRGNEVVVFNPTRGVIDIYQVSIQRLSGSYVQLGRNLKPRTSKRIKLTSFRQTSGEKFDVKEEGECRLMLEYWRGTEKEGPFFRYCRGF
ncbi:MAG: hypothetical protein SGI90_02565 [Candidatus Eisenbacteria bacterium]|nr:hypothetical protein [Candidatus Eisenbacteria bacterium]